MNPRPLGYEPEGVAFSANVSGLCQTAVPAFSCFQRDPGITQHLQNCGARAPEVEAFRLPRQPQARGFQVVAGGGVQVFGKTISVFSPGSQGRIDVCRLEHSQGECGEGRDAVKRPVHGYFAVTQRKLSKQRCPRCFGLAPNSGVLNIPRAGARPPSLDGSGRVSRLPLRTAPREGRHCCVRI